MMVSHGVAGCRPTLSDFSNNVTVLDRRKDGQHRESGVPGGKNAAPTRKNPLV
jgi:hypothetical protein